MFLIALYYNSCLGDSQIYNCYSRKKGDELRIKSPFLQLEMHLYIWIMYSWLNIYCSKGNFTGRKVFFSSWFSFIFSFSFIYMYICFSSLHYMFFLMILFFRIKSCHYTVLKCWLFKCFGLLNKKTKTFFFSLFFQILEYEEAAQGKMLQNDMLSV